MTTKREIILATGKRLSDSEDVKEKNRNESENRMEKTIQIIRYVTASLSDPDRGPYMQPQPAQTIWSGTDPAEAARIYYGQHISDCPAHPSGFPGISTSVDMPPAMRAAFDAALETQRDQRDTDRIIGRLPALPDGWDAAIGTQHDPEIVALRSAKYRETSYGDVVFLRPGQAGYEMAKQISRPAAGRWS